MVNAGRKYDAEEEFGMKGYTFNPKLIHGFNRNHRVP